MESAAEKTPISASEGTLNGASVSEEEDECVRDWGFNLEALYKLSKKFYKGM